MNSQGQEFYCSDIITPILMNLSFTGLFAGIFFAKAKMSWFRVEFIRKKMKGTDSIDRGENLLMIRTGNLISLFLVEEGQTFSSSANIASSHQRVTGVGNCSSIHLLVKQMTLFIVQLFSSKYATLVAKVLLMKLYHSFLLKWSLLLTAGHIWLQRHFFHSSIFSWQAS